MIINYQTIFQSFYGQFTIILLVNFLIFFEKKFFNKFNLIARVSFEDYFQFFFHRIKYFKSNQLTNLFNLYFIKLIKVLSQFQKFADLQKNKLFINGRVQVRNLWQ